MDGRSLRQKVWWNGVLRRFIVSTLVTSDRKPRGISQVLSFFNVLTFYFYVALKEFGSASKHKLFPEKQKKTFSEFKILKSFAELVEFVGAVLQHLYQAMPVQAANLKKILT